MRPVEAGRSVVDMPNRQRPGERRERPRTSGPGPRSRGDPKASIDVEKSGMERVLHSVEEVQARWPLGT